MILVTLALAGCGNSLEPSEIAGTYQLVSVNGHPLPWRPNDPDRPFLTEVRAGSLVLNADQSGRLTTVELQGDGVERSPGADVSWAASNDRVQLQFTAGIFVDNHAATLEDGDLTIRFSAGDLLPFGTYLYRKQP